MGNIDDRYAKRRESIGDTFLIRLYGIWWIFAHRNRPPYAYGLSF